MNFKDIIAQKKGFTIVEILVVIAVVGILASISVVGYGAWKKSASTAQVKNDLNAAAAAMENARTFSNAYPATLPGTVTPSTGVALSGGSADSGKTYCVDGSSLADTTIVYYVESAASEKGAQAGTCATRPNLPAPTVPGNLAVVSAAGTTVNLSWTASTNVISYTAQCASDPSFSLGLQESTHTTLTGAVSGLTLASSYYCRVKAVNNTGSSSWSSRVSTATNDAYGSLAVATSIEGYWTTAPQGFLLEDGSEVSRTTYSSLFAVIGTTYGNGDGNLTFNLPDSRGRTTVNLNSLDPEFAAIGQLTGSKTEALAIAQLASHTHTQNAHTHSTTNPSHNHTQNAHSHEGRRTQNGDYLGLIGGGQGGWGLDGYSAFNNNIFRMIPSATTATNNSATTAVSVDSATAVNQSTGSGSTHNNIQPSIVKMSAIKYSPVDLTAKTLPEGTSIQGYWSSAPSGFALENGAAVSRTTYAALFGAIGTTYGVGDGSTTFNLPDSQGRVGVNKSTDVEFDTMGEKPGSKTESLTIDQLANHNHTQNAHNHGATNPAHNHTQNAHTHTANNSTNNDAVGISGSGGTEGGWGISNPSNGNIYRLILTSTTATNNSATTAVSVDSATAVNQSTGSGSTHNNIQPSIVKMSAIKMTAATSAGVSVAPGTSVGGYWNSATPPTGYLLENGAAVSRTTYAALFGAIGTTYGVGDGSTTFNLPDSQGRVGVNKSTDVEFDTMGEKPGSKTESLTIDQLANHNHTQNAHNHGATNPAHNHTQNAHQHEGRSTSNGDFLGLQSGGQGGWALRAGVNNQIYRLVFTNTTATNNSATTTVSFSAATAVNQSTGSGSTHNNIQPSIVKMFVIKY